MKTVTKLLFATVGLLLLSTGSALAGENPWLQQAKLMALDGDANNRFGHAVALSGDTALISRENPGSGPEAESKVYVFVFEDGEWSEQAILIPDESPIECADGACPFFGWSVALDGDLAVVGAPGHFNADLSGAAYIFRRTGENWTQEAKLSPSAGGSNTDRFGWSVAASGETVVVGATWAEVDGNNRQGSAYVFVHDGAGWVEQARLMPTEDFPMPGCPTSACPEFGFAVAATGDTVLVGAENFRINGNNRRGAAFVFTRSGTDWTEQARLIAADGAASHFFGTAVALMEDRSVVGARGGAAAYVFERDEGIWSEQAKLTASDGGAQFGAAVTLAGDRIVVGAWNAAVDGVNQGAAYLFDYEDDTWDERFKLGATDGVAGDQFGIRVALKAGRLLVGASRANIGENTDQGAAYVFIPGEPGLSFEPSTLNLGDVEVGDTNSQIVALHNIGGADATGLAFGSLSGGFAGDTGDCGDSLPAGESCEINISFTPVAAGPANASLSVTSTENATASLPVAGNGTAPAVLQVSPATHDYGGLTIGESASRTITVSNAAIAGGESLVLSALELAGDPEFDHTGGSCAVDTALAPGQNCTVQIRFSPQSVDAFEAVLTAESGDGQSGAVNLTGSGFEVPEPWLARAQVLPSNPETDFQFGVSVALSGDTALVGSYGDMEEFGPITTGRAYVMTRDDDVWSEQAILQPDEYPILCTVSLGTQLPACPYFGWSVAIDGDIAVVGAPYLRRRNDNPQTLQPVPPGTVYVFQRAGGEWVQHSKLMASDGTLGNQFGHSVAIQGDTIVVGAPYAEVAEDPGHDGQGAVYVFERQGNDWMEHARLEPIHDESWPMGRCQITSSDPLCPRFGASVALDGDTVVVGSIRFFTGVQGPTAHYDQRGGAHLFTRDTDTGTWGPGVRMEIDVAAEGGLDFHIGWAVAINGDTVLVGAPGARVEGSNAQVGAVYVFFNDGSGWGRQARIPAPQDTDVPFGTTQRFGESVALLGDTAVIGGPFTRVDGVVGRGAAHLFGRSGESWARSQRLQLHDYEYHWWDHLRFGYSVALSENAVLLGGPFAGYDGVFTGIAYEFTPVNDELAFEPSASVNFGSEMDLGQTRVRKAILHNLGEQDLTGLIFGALDHGFAADTTECGDTLAVGESCDIELSFSPLAATGPTSTVLTVGSHQGLAAELKLLYGIGPPPADTVFRDRFEMQ